MANLFIVELKRTIATPFSYKKLQKFCIDGTVAFVKTDVIKNVFSSLNSCRCNYHGNFQCIMRIEQNNQIPSFDMKFRNN